MRKPTVAIAIGMLCCAILAGCGKTENNAQPADNTDVLSRDVTDPESENTAEKSAAESDPKTEEPSDKDKEDDPAVTEQTGSEEAEPEKKDRREQYQEILYKYKEVQDGKYSQEQLEEAGFRTELIQFGWPFAVAEDAVRYLYYDVDDDGEDELIITYNDHINDIYGYDGENVRLAFSLPYRGIANLYPDGMLCLIFAITASDYHTTWYKYDTVLGDYFSDFEERYDQRQGDQYYTFCYHDISEEEHKELEDSYRKSGYYPVWIGEWSDEISADEYKKLVPKTSEIKLPEGEPLSGVKLPDDYKPMITDGDKTSGQTDGGNRNDTEGQKLDLTKDMQKKLNIFLSNFAEQGMNSYDYGHPDMYRIGYFAFRWSYLNKYKDVRMENNYYTVSFDVVKNLADRYLGLSLSREDLEAYGKPDEKYESYFKNGDYYIPAADGETYPGFAVVESAEDLGEGQLRLIFTTYDLDLDLYWDMDDDMMQKFYALTPEEAVAKTAVNEYGTSQLTETGRGFAIVRSEGDSYKLRYYELYR